MTGLAEVLIKEQEGLRLTVYKDTLGIPTIGWGHVLASGSTISEISMSQAEAYFDSDLELALTWASQFPDFSALDEVRQAVLISMCFQMGSRPLQWPNFVEAMKEQDWERAADAGLDSLWARQTPSRALLEMHMLETGLWTAA